MDKINKELKKLLMMIKEEHSLDSLESAYNLLDVNWHYSNDSDPFSGADSDFKDENEEIITVHGVLTEKPK